MSPVSISIKTENLQLPDNAVRHSIETDNGYTIEVTSVCAAQTRLLAADFSLALEYGAVPAVQARMIDAVQDFEDLKVPLHCVLSFGV